jgi:uncharacterized protein YkwD
MRSPARTALTALVVASFMLATVSCAPPVARLIGSSTSMRSAPVVHVAAPSPRMRSSRAIASALLTKMNAERHARHLRPLQPNSLLADWANRWARHLIAIGGFRHQDLGRIIVASHYRLEEVGENLFRGSGRGAADAGTAHVTLMHSLTHRENLLLPQAQLVGVAALCVGQRLLVVEDFGIKSGAPLPPRGQRVLPARPLIEKSVGGPSC